MIHSATSNAGSCGSGSRLGAAISDGRSTQQLEISTTDWGARQNGGEVMLAISPGMLARN
jgi:hypothetical protein